MEQTLRVLLKQEKSTISFQFFTNVNLGTIKDVFFQAC